jgi:putative membrane protein
MVAMMFWYGAHWAFWQVSVMWIGMILFWALLAWAVYALVTAATRKPRRGGDDEGNARRILDERLARGEIDEAEYQRLRSLIGSGDQHEPAGARTAH